MSDDPNNLHFREQAETKALNSYSEEAQRRYPHITAKQSAVIAESMFSTYGAPVDGVNNETYFWYLAKQRPDLFRTAPTPHQALEWRCKQLGNVSEPQRLTEWRKIARFSADELLALVPHDAELSATCAPLQDKKEAPALTDEQRAKGWTAEDAQLAAQSSIDPNTMDPRRRLEVRQMIAAQMAPLPRDKIDEALAHIAGGKTWSQLHWSVQRPAFDQAKALGKSLRDFGVDVSA